MNVIERRLYTNLPTIENSHIRIDMTRDAFGTNVYLKIELNGECHKSFISRFINKREAYLMVKQVNKMSGVNMAEELFSNFYFTSIEIESSSSLGNPTTLNFVSNSISSHLYDNSNTRYIQKSIF